MRGEYGAYLSASTSPSSLDTPAKKIRSRLCQISIRRGIILAAVRNGARISFCLPSDQWLHKNHSIVKVCTSSQYRFRGHQLLVAQMEYSSPRIYEAWRDRWLRKEMRQTKTLYISSFDSTSHSTSRCCSKETWPQRGEAGSVNPYSIPDQYCKVAWQSHSRIIWARDVIFLWSL